MSVLNNAIMPIFELLVDRLVGSEHIIYFLVNALLDVEFLNTADLSKGLIGWIVSGSFAFFLSDVHYSFALANFAKFPFWKWFRQVSQLCNMNIDGLGQVASI